MVQRGRRAARGLAYLLLLIAARRTLPPTEQRLTGGGRSFVNLMGAFAVALLAIVFWFRQVGVVFLVQVSCIAVAESGPLKLVGSQSVLQTGIPNFLRTSVAGTAVSAVLLFVIWRFLSRPNSARRRWLLGSLLAVGLASGFAIVAWIAGPGLRHASPWMAETFVIAPANLWLTAIILIAILAAVIAIRWCAFLPGNDRKTRLVWLRDRRAYCHEGVGWALVLAVAAGSRAWEIFGYVNAFARDWIGIAGSMAEYAVEDCESVLAILVCCVALGRLWQILRRRSLTAPIEITDFNPQRFITGWVLLFLVALIALPSLAALSVSLYFTRWYDLPFLDW